MASSEAALFRRLRGACSSRSRTTSDFETFRSRDSDSMSATNASGNRTVSVFMESVYYACGRLARQRNQLASIADSIMMERGAMGKKLDGQQSQRKHRETQLKTF